MALPYNEIITSPIFRFLVGPEEKEFALHAAAVANLSRPLDVLLNGYMQEAREKSARLKEDDADTFVLFAQYVYTRDYAEPKPVEDAALDEKDQSKEESKASTVQEEQNDWEAEEPWESDMSSAERDDAWPPPWVPITPQITPGSWADFTSKTFSCPDPYISRGWRVNLRPNENYRPVFLSHAKVYVFAEKYDIEGLRNLALHKIHGMLCAFRLYPERVVDIVELVRFTYLNTLDTNNEPLRKLVMHYLACTSDTLAESSAFRELLEEMPQQLSWDIISSMATRLNGESRKIRSAWGDCFGTESPNDLWRS